MVAPEPVLARRRHYAHFYGLEPVVADGRRVAVVYGNCQAEALRVVLAGSSEEVLAVRIPAVHELTVDDLPHLSHLLGQADLLLSQPVGDDWRGLPIGTGQAAELLPAGGQVIRWPVIRHTGLHPHAAIIRTPWMGDPPVAPYHDLRTVLAVARGTPDRPQGHGRPEGYRAVAAASIAELRRREVEQELVPVSDLVEQAGAGATLTINHPGNAVLVPLAGRVLGACGLDAEPRDPGRVLLRSIQAPVAADVLEAQGLAPGLARDRWEIEGQAIEDEAVAEQQAPWYAERGPVVEAALQRYAPAIEALGL